MDRLTLSKEQTIEDRLTAAFNHGGNETKKPVLPGEKTSQYPRCLDGFKSPFYHRWYNYSHGTEEDEDGHHFYHDSSQCLDCGVQRERKYPMQILRDPDTTYHFREDGT